MVIGEVGTESRKPGVIDGFDKYTVLSIDGGPKVSKNIASG